MTSHVITTPTPERFQKPDFEKIAGKMKKMNNLKVLNERGEVDGVIFRNAEKWVEDYLFAEYGVADFLSDPLPTDFLKGDRHTFALLRGFARWRISEIRENFGENTHQILYCFLILGLSYINIGKIFCKKSKGSDLRKEAKGKCVLVLEQLSFFCEKNKKRDLPYWPS